MDKDKIKALFENNPDADKLIITSDGQAFAKRNDASFHASTLGVKTTNVVFRADYVNGNVQEAVNTDADNKVKEGAANGIKLSAEERIEKINACTTKDEVNALLEGEKAKTVIAAGEEKIESFK